MPGGKRPQPPLWHLWVILVCDNGNFCKMCLGRCLVPRHLQQLLGPCAGASRSVSTRPQDAMDGWLELFDLLCVGPLSPICRFVEASLVLLILFPTFAPTWPIRRADLIRLNGVSPAVTFARYNDAPHSVQHRGHNDCCQSVKACALEQSPP